ncbi:hypothetical protein COT97_02920 [Candidatus Falkowbacteria bacterium CG10_big_fil_rev_8_21_14_0_10_39_11]|uniref:Response regulatory domain-containing protein n=1 Tax=Candidatus Falkowbacteria bacterium CG10_big_fil_rev_8_21_14_0_10_39_11 TaxID=1974565 RepID=A0A2H0V4Z2_9BACT|nr:MAG: hypothetical protein COT97_02920 [Candidatus Falkowbacteria bacterium CG10_big_fil_rev_8_21_14_0_10_39_11]
MSEGKKRILVIDKDLLAEMVADQLNKYDEFKVFTAGNLGEAVSMIREAKFDLIVVEHFLAYGSAYELLKGESDPRMFYGAPRLIKFVRENLRINPPFVLIGSDPGLLNQSRQKFEIPAERVFLTPYSSFSFEKIVCDILAVECRLADDFIADEMNDHKSRRYFQD